jgi:lipopolysaccharide export system permease protein
LSLIDRYLIRMILSASLAALVGLTLVIWITQAMHDLDLITTQGQSLLQFLRVTSLTLPPMAAVIAPIAFYIGLLVALNRLNADSELVVLSASGMSSLRLAKPLAIAAFIASLACAFLTLSLVPSSIHTWRSLITQIRSDFLTKIVKPGGFNTLEKDLVFHYRERSGDALLGIFIQDSRDPELLIVYVAERGRIVQAKEGNYLVLENGSVQRETPRDRDASIVAFQRYALDSSQLAPGNDEVVYVPHERLTPDLLAAYVNRTEPTATEALIGAELADRFATPLFNFTFAALALALLGRPRTTRSRSFIVTVAAVALAAILRVAGFTIIVAAKDSQLLIATAIAFPVLASLAIAVGAIVTNRSNTSWSVPWLGRHKRVLV